MALNIDFEYDSKKDGFVYCIKDKETDSELATSPDAFKSPREAMRACLHRLNSQGMTNIPEYEIERCVAKYRDTKWA